MSEQDTYAARVQAALSGQYAPPASDRSGRRVLYRCNTCGRAWLMDGARVELALSGERLAALAMELHADTGTLPYATCRICGAAHDIGELGMDEYGAGVQVGGYGFYWEGVEPPGAHLLGTIIGADYMTAQRATPRAGVVTRYATCRAVLAWLAALHSPTEYRRFTADDSAAMASDNPPGHRAPGTDGWVWQGVFFMAKCPPLGGRALVSLGQAMPPGEAFSVVDMLAGWRALARIMLAGSIAGEETQADQTDSEG